VKSCFLSFSNNSNLSFKLFKSGAKLNLIFILSFTLNFLSTRYSNFGVFISTEAQVPSLYKSQSLFETVTLYFVAPKNQSFGMYSKTDEVVHLQVHSSFGSISIGQGNLSFASKLVNAIIGILKNTAMFCHKLSSSHSGTIFKTFAHSITETI
jgi:hypothetical protein